MISKANLLISIDMYAPVIGQSPLIDALITRLRKKVKHELKFQVECIKIRGALEMLFGSSALLASDGQ